MISRNSLFSYFVVILFVPFTNNYSQNVFVQNLNDLDFGDVFIGSVAQVQHTDPGAAKFLVYHNYFWRRINITFSLPNVLTNGGDSIPINFDLNHSAYSYSDRINGRNNFNPFNGINIRFMFFFQRLYIWLGGSLPSTAGVPPGLYQGTIVITAEFY